MEDHELRRRVLQTTLEEAKGRTQIDKESSAACVICLEQLSEPAVAQPCRHDNFDYICLLSWLEEQYSCPLCKGDILSVSYFDKAQGKRRLYTVPLRPKPKLLESRNNTLQEPGSNFEGRRYRPRNRRAFQQVHPPLEPDEALLRRQFVYKHGLYSLHVGSNRISRFRDITPEIFTRDEEAVTRARKWIRRELQVFDFLAPESGNTEGNQRKAGNREFLLEYIIAILKTVNIQGSSGHAEQLVSDFLGRDYARLFLHELKAWLRSPYVGLQDWDRHIQYDERRLTPNGPTKRLHTSADIRDEPGSPNSSQSYPSKRRVDRYRPYPASHALRKHRQHRRYDD